MIRGFTSSTTTASSPTPAIARKCRENPSGRVIFPTAIRTASHSLTSFRAAFSGFVPNPISQHNTFAVPPGKIPNTARVPIIPFATSFTVPSPPNATTVVAPFATASPASFPAVFGPVVGTTRTVPNGANHPAARSINSGRRRNRPAIGL